MHQGQRLPSLTALKGAFIWIIVLHNSFLIESLFEDVPGMSFIRLYGGSLGNSMFLILSGFLMALAYRDRLLGGALSFGTFLTRRLKKLYPMYVLSNAAALVVAVWQYGISAINIKRIVFTLLMVQGTGLNMEAPYNSPSWFASAILVCYILYYAMTNRAKTMTQYRVFLAVGIVLGYYLSTSDLKFPFCYGGSGTAYLNFFIGCALAEVYPGLKRYGRWLRPGCLILVTGSLYLMMAYGIEVISGGSAEAFAFAICPMILYLAYGDGVICRILQWKPLVYLGKVSMNVFYWHLVLYFAMRQLLGGMTRGQYGLYLLLVLLAAIMLERIQEHKKITARI